MSEYYGLRPSAGLFISEGTAPSAHGLGYPRIPGIYNVEQIKRWQNVTKNVHKKEGKIIISGELDKEKLKRLSIMTKPNW